MNILREMDIRHIDLGKLFKIVENGKAYINKKLFTETNDLNYDWKNEKNIISTNLMRVCELYRFGKDEEASELFDKTENQKIKMYKKTDK